LRLIRRSEWSDTNSDKHYIELSKTTTTLDQAGTATTQSHQNIKTEKKTNLWKRFTQLEEQIKKVELLLLLES